VRNGGKYEVLSGLHEGDIVASSGGFLLDSERQLRGGGTATTTSVEHNHNHASTSK
jgi:hypothetical protein